ncbi:Snf2/Rad54-like helicase [Encephalitozoon hellem ATCC 50504]|uniref:SNF2 family N-terminal domain-containing protein n=1 Tax=Encephalitozoon hellem TaxID=27973 RepID=A0A9Q9F8F9_ENCHE|nr:Snf2/Rad54-like helicase [Encephalitozoon hellem ATCC 50504]AFM98448.1 Snf2/Rad54-like helicase [Encephalitozoon hellem ATCC 50504]UTX43373.1 SNF2 family N-terminal domain-containing protein [Encephalitozoon hellem]|eukprot:XP_003887429.1 Snf2/Rad54-like helicase [Encephalitozoon hellem ATCC 50504]
MGKESRERAIEARLSRPKEDPMGKSPDLKEEVNSIKIKVYVGEDGRVVLKPSNKRLSTELSKLEESMYDIKSNEWRISVRDYISVRGELRRNKLVFDEIPKGTLRIAGKEMDEEEFELAGDIYDMLLPFQREGVRYALSRRGRIIIADDMGLGKTIQALAVSYYYRSEWPLLIIAPASLLDDWADACKRFLGEEAMVMRRKGDFGQTIGVVSYEVASSNVSGLLEHKAGVVIVDECHYLKSLNTKRTKAIVPLLQKVPRAILLSGTPAVSRPLELYPIIASIDRTIFPRFAEYGARYCNGRKVGLWYDYKGCSNAEELHYVLKKCLMIRRTKDEVLSQLPPKFRRQVILQCEGKQSDPRKEVVGESVDANVVVQYKEAVKLKMGPVKQYLATMLEKSMKFVVFCHHSEMMDGIEEFFVERRVPMIRIDGSVPSGNRHPLVRDFQENDEIRVALLSITACSTGLTLTAGRAVVFAELYWNPGVLLQAEDRIHRIGQKGSVDIIYLVARGTIDEYVWPKLLSKLNVLESLGIGSNQLKNVGVSSQSSGQKTLYQLNIKKCN